MNLYDKPFLCSNLCFIYRMIVASAPLLEFAIERSDGDLRDYYLKHLGEETGHDEMLQDDLLRLGVVEIPRYHRAAQIAGSQYYLIAHESPALLLGYMHALEKQATDLSLVDELSTHHGVDLTAMRHHAIHDPHHNEELETMIGRMGPEVQAAIAWNERCVRKSLIDAITVECY